MINHNVSFLPILFFHHSFFFTIDNQLLRSQFHWRVNQKKVCWKRWELEQTCKKRNYHAVRRPCFVLAGRPFQCEISRWVSGWDNGKRLMTSLKCQVDSVWSRACFGPLEALIFQMSPGEIWALSSTFFLLKVVTKFVGPLIYLICDKEFEKKIMLN